MRCTAAVLCLVLLESHGGGKQSPPNPDCVTPAAARTMLYLVLPGGRAEKVPEHFGPTPLAFRGSRRLWCVKPSTHVSNLIRRRGESSFNGNSSGYRSEARLPSRWSSRGLAEERPAPVKSSRPTTVGPHLSLEPLEKRDQKLYLRPTCNHPGRRDLYERLGWGVARGLTALAFASTPSLRERPRFTPRRTLRTHTPPTSLCAKDQDPEPLALPGN